MAIYSPVLMRAGTQTGLSYGAITYGPFVVAGKLFCVLCAGSGAFAGVFKSTNGGATWAQVDAANAPNHAVSTSTLNGTVLTTAYVSAGEIRLKDFDCVAEVWGAAYGTVGSPVGVTNLACVVKRAGSVLVLYDNAPPPPVLPASNLWGVSMVAGVYGVPFDVGINQAAEAGWIVGSRISVSISCGVLDASNTYHVTFYNAASGLLSYQQILSTDVLAHYHLFTEDLQVTSGSPLGKPVIFGGKLVIPTSANVVWPGPPPRTRTMATVFVATPLNAPVFTLLGVPGIDPTDADYLAFGVNFNVPNNAPFLSTDGTTMYAIWPREDAEGTGLDFSQIRLSKTVNSANPLAGWAAVTIFDLALDSPPGFNFVGQKLQLPAIAPVCNAQLVVSLDAFTVDVAHEDRYWFGNFAGCAAVITSAIINADALAVVPLPNPAGSCAPGM